MLSRMDCLSKERIISEKGKAVIYEIKSLTIHGGYAKSTILFDKDLTQTSIHTPFVLEWNKDENTLRILGIKYNSQNTLEQGIRCLAAFILVHHEQEWLDPNKELCQYQPEYEEKLGLYTLTYQEAYFPSDYITRRIIYLVKNKKFRKEIFNMLKIAKIRAKVPNFTGNFF